MASFLEWFKKHSSEYQAALFDIDGTITIGPNPLPGNSSVIEYMRKINFPFFFLTNDGLHGHAAKQRQLMKAGVTAYEDEIVSAGGAMKVAAEKLALTGKKVFLLGQGGDQEDYISKGGMIPVTGENMDGCSAMVVGEGVFDWYTDINAAVNFLKVHKGIPIIVANPDSFWAGGKNGTLGIGAGGIARFITTILRDMGEEREIYYTGKPNRSIYIATIERLKQKFNMDNVDNSRILMLGDALFSDILGGNSMGMTSVLMMTGVTNDKMLAAAEKDRVPAFVFDTLG